MAVPGSFYCEPFSARVTDCGMPPCSFFAERGLHGTVAKAAAARNEIGAIMPFEPACRFNDRSHREHRGSDL